MDGALDAYVRSNLARRNGTWPNRDARVKQVASRIRSADSWFLVAVDEDDVVAMAVAEPLRSDEGRGPPIPESCFLNLIFVSPDRWGQGNGEKLLDSVLDDARQRGYARMRLFTDEEDNEQAQRLYRRHGFAPTGQRLSNEEGTLIGEWAAEIP
jgi:GNAT superfamily N-acetyltransferase